MNTYELRNLVREANWPESALTVGWFTFVFSLWARAWLRKRLQR